jgi:hypothetical protein
LNLEHCSAHIILAHSVADPDTESKIRDPMLFRPLDLGSGSGMSYLFDFKDFFLKPKEARKR